MRTIKRTIPDINTDIDNYSKYFNQFNWKGINEAKNIFEVDQESFRECDNVFVDYDDQLVSRNPLMEESLNLKETLPPNSELVKIERFGDVEVLVFKNQDGYAITARKGGSTTTTSVLRNLEKYHLSAIGQYIICFNNVAARVYDTLNISKGWQPLYNFVDLPVTKRVVGGTVTEYPVNQFTKSYKEEYVWSDNSRPTLPKYKQADSIEVTSERESLTWTLPDTNILTDYRILRKLNIKLFEDDLISTAGSTICIGRSTYFLVSYDEGNTFSKIEYPAYDRFCNIASISEDGSYFFFVATNAVYRYSFSDESWSYIDYSLTPNDGSLIVYPGLNPIDFQYVKGINNGGSFLTGDIFSFVLCVNPDPDNSSYFYSYRLYAMGPGLKDVARRNEGSLICKAFSRVSFTPLEDNSMFNDKTAKDLNRFMTKITYNSVDNKALAVGILNDRDTSNVEVCVIDAKNLFNAKSILLPDTKNGYILSAYYITDSQLTPSDCISLEVIVYDTTKNKWTKIKSITNGVDTNNTINELGISSYNTVPFELLGGWIAGSTVYSKDFTEEAILPTELIENDRINTFIINDFLYVQYGNDVYTNNFSTSDSALLTYTYNFSEDLFTEVPDCSYSGTELYLGFGNTLKITSNVQEDNVLKLSLPPINNQSFIDSINGIINISTTDVALFFRDKITVCTRVEDETFGFRYDYYNTKLLLGIMPGDSVLNTLEGSYTIFPTKRGLAFMNYQQFMSTTDQIVSYISDPIENLWESFYNDKSYIKIIQWRRHLVLSNGSTTLLLFDFRTNSWWKWTIPLNTSEILTYQDSLKLISKTLYSFEESDDRYLDFPKTTYQKEIKWFITSQVLHFNAPTYYKNLKQLIFKLSETNNLKNTINVQIKLYRKSVTLKEPDIIDFKIDELRTFVKRFNYWKINELQWGLSNDDYTKIPARLILNGISIKYEIGEEVR